VVVEHVDPARLLHALRLAPEDERARSWVAKLFMRAAEVLADVTPPGGAGAGTECDSPKNAKTTASAVAADDTHDPLQCPLDESSFTIIDCEATGPDPALDRLVEAAAVRLTPDGQISLICDTLIDPGVPIPATASAIHHITDADVAGATTPAVARARFQNLGPVFAAHSPQLDAALLDLADRVWVCTYRLSLHLWPDAPAHGNQVLRYWLDLNPTLPNNLHPHRAASDALVTAYLLKRELALLRERHPEIKTVAQLVQFAESPVELTYIPFRSHRGMKWADADESFLEWVLSRDFSRDIHYTARRCLDRLDCEQ